MKKIITTGNITAKWHKGIAQGYSFNSEFNPNSSTIRVYGHYDNRYGGPASFDRVFKIGDVVEYGSYNLSYMGTILKISDKVVEININGTYEHYKDKAPEIKRLKIWEFIDRNWDFNFEKKFAENCEISHCI